MRPSTVVINEMIMADSHPIILLSMGQAGMAESLLSMTS
jgi:hypothetical protein